MRKNERLKPFVFKGSKRFFLLKCQRRDYSLYNKKKSTLQKVYCSFTRQQVYLSFLKVLPELTDTVSL